MTKLRNNEGHKNKKIQRLETSISFLNSNGIKLNQANWILSYRT